MAVKIFFNFTIQFITKIFMKNIRWDYVKCKNDDIVYK